MQIERRPVQLTGRPERVRERLYAPHHWSRHYDGNASEARTGLVAADTVTCAIVHTPTISRCGELSAENAAIANKGAAGRINH